MLFPVSFLWASSGLTVPVSINLALLHLNQSRSSSSEQLNPVGDLFSTCTYKCIVPSSKTLALAHRCPLFLLLFNYSCPHFPPLLFSALPTLTSHIQSSPLRCRCPWVFYTCSLMTFPLPSPVTPLLPPLWSLSICSLFPCLRFYFPPLFVLLIMFHL